MILRWILLTIVLFSMTACAKPPQFELDTAEQVVEQARSLEAAEYAPTEFQAASEALEDGRALMRKGEYRSARVTLRFALEHARRAVLVTQEARARQAADELARREAAAEEIRQEAERNRLAAAKARQAAIEETKAKPRQADDKKPAPRPEPAPAKEVLTYKVGEGETLWIISALPAVYNDAHLWPLLYQANRDQIKDPRQIFPGQILNIRRDLTAQEIEEARQKAEESDIFPIPKP